ncbi:MAG: gliding motility-associated C-terminal domain-containing protein [Sediminicola sp.]
MKNFLKRFVVMVFLCHFGSTFAQSVGMTVQQGPNIDVMLTVGSANVDLSTFEADLEQSMHSKGIPLGKLRVEAFQRSSISSDQADASEIFNSWNKMNFNGTEPPVHSSYAGNYFSFDAGTNSISADYVSRYNGYGYAMYDPTGDISDGTISATFGLNGAPGAHAEVGFIFRKVDNQNFYAYIIDNHTACGNLMNYANGDGYPAEAILKVQNGVTTILAVNTNSARANLPINWNSSRTDMFAAYYDGQQIDFKIEMSNDQIKVSRRGGGGNAGTDWIQSFDVTDASHSSGSYGFYVHEQSGAYFKDIEITKLSLRAFKDVLREPQWRNKALRFNVNLDDLEVADFEDDSDLSEILMRTINEDIHYLGWGVNANQAQFERFVAQNNTQGTFVNRDVSSYASSVDQIAQYIFEQYQIGTISEGNYFIAGISVEIDVNPAQLKSNTANASYPAGRWKIAHDETYFPNDNGKVSWDGLYLEDVPELYNKTGKYSFTFEDLPTAPTTLYFHRKPVASFTYSANSGLINDTSYDLDGGANNGIAETEWKWKPVDAQTTNDWNIGQFDKNSVADGEYLIMQRVRDHQGVWSSPSSIFVEKSAATAGTEDLPLAQFNISPDVLTTYSGAMTITVDNNSVDPYARTLDTEEWIVTKRVYDVDGNPTDTQIYNSGAPLTDFSAYNTESAEYIISLRTRTDSGVWSLPFYRTLTVIDDSVPPTVTATPASGAVDTEDIVVLAFLDETSGSGFDVQRYAITQNNSAPANDATSWRSWSNGQTKEITFPSGGNGWYIHAQVKDNAGNLGTASFGPYDVTLILTAVDDLALTDEETESDPIEILFNDKYDLGNVPTITITVQGTKGTAVVEDNKVVYTPNENEFGTDTVTYTIEQAGESSSADITISIQPVDDAPIAVADSFDVDENGTLNGDVSLNDIEVDEDDRLYHLVDGPDHASHFTFNSDGTFTYGQNGDEQTSDSFTYNFEDEVSFSETVTVTFNVNPVNDLPTGGDVAMDVVEDVPTAFSPSDFTFNDVDAGDGFNGIQIISMPAKGTLLYDGNPVALNDLIDDVTLLTFTTATGEFAADYASFGFKVKDQADALSVTTYSVDITALEDMDGDGVPNETDPDIDGDGMPNDEDDFPRDPTEDTDTDGDGTGDNEDTDDDNDGTPDDGDDFPKDPNEDTDTDGDGTGDNGDTDDDGDGTPDDEDDFPKDPTEDTDTDGDGMGDNEDTDDDNDGTPDDEDDFPKDPNEDTDTDGDGTGDNEDTDDDGDGTPDDEDAFPKDPNEDTDTDGDGTGDNEDTDDDGDGTPDDGDAFPKDPNEDTDTDGDGTGDNEDTDDDGDGTPDDGDAFPKDPNEDTDTDGDGTGDNGDTDDDNDGTPDDQDAFPKDPTEDTDTDGDGTGDNADGDIDGDGIPNEEDEYPFNDRPDTDGDGVVDSEDICSDTPVGANVDANGCAGSQKDTDADGITDDVDNAPNDFNPDQGDTDGDGIGDAEDTDDDNDGVPDDVDNCPLAHNPGQEDRDRDGLGDVCDTVVLDVAQAFTPDGDGINDTWTIHNIENYPNSLVRVFNSWGKEVFSARNYQNDWDGRYKDLSNKLPDAGSYYFQIDLEGDGKVDSDGWLYITSK